MKKVLIAMMVALAVLIPFAGTAMAAPPIHQASVGGTNYLGVVSNTIALSALQTAQGGPSPNAKGEFQLVARVAAGDIVLHADVLYMAVHPVLTNNAWIGIQITQSNNAGFPVGAQKVIRVIDNGEGSNATGPDQISLLQAGPASNALLSLPYPVQNWDNGNIQVK